MNPIFPKNFFYIPTFNKAYKKCILFYYKVVKNSAHHNEIFLIIRQLLFRCKDFDFFYFSRFLKEKKYMLSSRKILKEWSEYILRFFFLHHPCLFMKCYFLLAASFASEITFPWIIRLLFSPDNYLCAVQAEEKH